MTMSIIRDVQERNEICDVVYQNMYEFFSPMSTVVEMHTSYNGESKYFMSFLSNRMNGVIL